MVKRNTDPSWPGSRCGRAETLRDHPACGGSVISLPFDGTPSFPNSCTAVFVQNLLTH